MQILTNSQPGRWGCVDCGQRFDTIPSLGDHCRTTGHGTLPSNDAARRNAATSPTEPAHD